MADPFKFSDTDMSIPDWLSSQMAGLDTPAQSAIACLSEKSQGFTLPIDEFKKVMPQCLDPRNTLVREGNIAIPLPPASPNKVPQVEVVGRSLGSERLRAPADADPGAVRQLTSIPRDELVLVGFRPELSAGGQAQPFGRYEFAVARQRPKRDTHGDKAASFTDFFVIDNSSRSNAPVAIRPAPYFCTSCHQDGKPISSTAPWDEILRDKKYPDAAQNEASFYQSDVESASLAIGDRQWLMSLGERDYSTRQLIMSRTLRGPEHFSDAERERSEAALNAILAHSTFSVADEHLMSRQPTDFVPFVAEFDPLSPRMRVDGTGSTGPDGNEHFAGARSLSDLDEALDRRGFAPDANPMPEIRQLIGRGRYAKFIASQAFANVAFREWPMTASDLLSAARAFSLDATPADIPAVQRRLDALRASQAAGNAPLPKSQPKTPEEAFDVHCAGCHESGLAPSLDAGTLSSYVGKTPSRTAAYLIKTNIMPPGPALDEGSRSLLLDLATPKDDSAGLHQANWIAEPIRSQLANKGTILEHTPDGWTLELAIQELTAARAKYTHANVEEIRFSDQVLNDLKKEYTEQFFSPNQSDDLARDRSGPAEVLDTAVRTKGMAALRLQKAQILSAIAALEAAKLKYPRAFPVQIQVTDQILKGLKKQRDRL